MLERRNAPVKAVRWVQQHENEIFISVVSIAEVDFGLSNAPASHHPSLASWLTDIKRKFASATDELTLPVLIRWKELLVHLRTVNRTMTCEDSLIAATALYHGHTVVTRNIRHFASSGVATFDPAA
jgi:hypothetical protein